MNLLPLFFHRFLRHIISSLGYIIPSFGGGRGEAVPLFLLFLFLLSSCEISTAKKHQPMEMDAVDSAFAQLEISDSYQSSKNPSSSSPQSSSSEPRSSSSSQSSSLVDLVTTDQLLIFFPHFSSMDLVCKIMPKPETDSEVIFCCEAAFTGELLLEFKHSNIADPHVSGGTWYKGYTCKANTGAFMWYQGTWRFAKKPIDLHPVADKGGMAFCQHLLILDGKTQPMWERMRKNKTQYRALCEKDHRLCIIESKNVITLERFISLLEQQHVTNAIYLDMGRGWNYAWYRSDDNKVDYLHPLIQIPFTTNWLTFKR